MRQIGARTTTLSLKQATPRRSGKKIFVKLFQNTKRAKKLYLLLDSGSDISFIHVNQLNRVLSQKEIERGRSVNTHEVITFSSQQVKILYNITLPWGPRKHGPSVPLTLSLYDHKDMLGQDTMQELQMTLSFARQNVENKPVVNIFKPEKASLKCKYIWLNVQHMSLSNQYLQYLLS